MRVQVLIAALALFSFAFPTPVRAGENTQALIQDLRLQIQALQEQLREMRNPGEEISAGPQISRNLRSGDRGEDVRLLQKALNREKETRVADSGPGSPGNETAFFGPKTANAVRRFQERYRNDVLSPWGFSSGTGIAGSTTRAKLNELASGRDILPGAVSISGTDLRQSDTLVIKVAGFSTKLKGEFGGMPVDFFREGERSSQAAIVGIDVNRRPGTVSLVIREEGGGSFAAGIRVNNGNFRVTRLVTTPDLEEKGYTPSGIQENAAARDNVRLYEVLDRYHPEALLEGKFAFPLNEIMNVGAYGDLRTGGGVSLRHLGVDLDAKEGENVYAVNSGIVRFAQETSNYGKTMIIDHGLGIYSLYLHLSAYGKSEGQSVEKEEWIASSGNTGYSLAPHLHFSVRVNGTSVDPLRFLETVNKYLD